MAQPAGNLDIADLISAKSALTDSITASYGDLLNSRKDLLDLGARQKEGIKQVSEGEVEKNVAEQKAEIAKKAHNTQAASIFGTNPDASSYILAAMSEDVLNIEKDLSNRDKMIQQKLDTGFADDPLGWFVNQFTIPADIAAYNNRVGTLNQKNDMMKSMLTKTTEAYAVNAGIDTAASVEKLNALNKITLGKAQVDMANSEAMVAQLGLSQLNIKNALDERQFQAVVQTQNAQVRLAELALAQSRESREREEGVLKQELQRLQITAHKDDLENKAMFQAKLDKATDTFQMARVPLKEFLTWTGARKDVMDRLMSDPDVQNRGIMANSPAKAVEMFNAMGTTGSPGANIIRKQLTTISNEVAETNSALWKNKTPAEKFELIDKKAEAIIKREYANTPNTGSIFSPPPLAASITTSPSVQTSALAQALAPIAAADKNAPTDASLIYKTALDLVASGKVTPEDAAHQATLLYQGVVSSNNFNRPYSRFALEGPTEFKTNVYTGNGWTGSKIMTLTNEAEWQAALTRGAIAAKKPSAETFGIPQ